MSAMGGTNDINKYHICLCRGHRICILFIYSCIYFLAQIYGAHCTNARAQSRLPRCPIFGGEFVLNRTAFWIAPVFSMAVAVRSFGSLVWSGLRVRPESR